MSLIIIGEPPVITTEPAQFRKGIATLFPASNVLVTLPGIHALHRPACIEQLNSVRAQAGQAPLSADEEAAVWADAVDLFFEEECIQIRPFPDDLAPTFAADELLQQLTSKTNIKFLHATNQTVLAAIRKRGEYWRISPLPKSSAEIQKMVMDSRCAIAGEPVYFHNRLTGTRFLTCEAFQQLGRLDTDALARHLVEIQEFAGRRNRQLAPEIAFFQAAGFSASDFTGLDFARLSPADLRAGFAALAARFSAAVPPELLHDDPNSPEWLKAMFAALIGEQDEKISEELMRGLSAEYLLQPLWLPGCRIENGELIRDSVFDEARTKNTEKICDPRAIGFIANFVREYGELDYVNLAWLPRTLSRRLATDGQRGVYLVELKPRSSPQPVVCILRMQKWDVADRLDQGMDLLGAMLQSAEYTDYVLNRRLACRQLGMNLPVRIMVHRLCEPYTGLNDRYRGQHIWNIYFERDYAAGLATDKIAPGKLENEEYALRLAALLGRAAAPNLIVGRLDVNHKVLFDDGDEIVLEEGGLPASIMVADPTGAFADFLSPLGYYAEFYAAPVNKRRAWLRHPADFARAYLAALESELGRIQAEYRQRRRAFDALFQYLPVKDPQGNFTYRWEKVLERLDRAQPAVVIKAIGTHITV